VGRQRRRLRARGDRDADPAFRVGPPALTSLLPDVHVAVAVLRPRTVLGGPGAGRGDAGSAPREHPIRAMSADDQLITGPRGRRQELTVDPGGVHGPREVPRFRGGAPERRRGSSPRTRSCLIPRLTRSWRPPIERHGQALALQERTARRSRAGIRRGGNGGEPRDAMD